MSRCTDATREHFRRLQAVTNGVLGELALEPVMPAAVR